MHTLTALKKLDILTIAEVKHLLQQCDNDIERYKSAISNYPPDRMEQHGMPYLKQLETNRDKVKLRLEQMSP